eukprot:TRINITY_DN14870_c0_g1_i2.p1 TRINITY_DN14870_c0_g1~~TRINITY_DN14870_c0_g1_i2.p1  ORF type:complete len:127 (-),score=44.61 TRINITY_DN14870_c0_g1_i2:305-685(-)
MEKSQQVFCKKILKNLLQMKESWPFMEPVDPIALKIPNYLEIIKKPMDLSTVNEKLDNDEYESLQMFKEDVRLIWKNAERFNGPKHQITKKAKMLSEVFEKQMEHISKKEERARKEKRKKDQEEIR